MCEAVGQRGTTEALPGRLLLWRRFAEAGHGRSQREGRAESALPRIRVRTAFASRELLVVFDFRCGEQGLQDLLRGVRHGKLGSLRREALGLEP